jgi:hypothetical protein
VQLDCFFCSSSLLSVVGMILADCHIVEHRCRLRMVWVVDAVLCPVVRNWLDHVKLVGLCRTVSKMAFHVTV